VSNRLNVIYCRFSSEMQRTDSNVDQERRCRDALNRMGLDNLDFEVIRDEAISGISESRPGLVEIHKLISSSRLGVLIVAEQSRLTRGDNATSVIKDIVYHGGRFIAVAEGLDTERKGWKLVAGISGIHHARSNEDTAERVRGGQEGRVMDGYGSAGDFPYGYDSEYADPNSAIAYRGRGPKPKKIVVIDPAACEVVREIFSRFVDNQSMSEIVRWLNGIRDTIPIIGKGPWHHQHVRRILTNTKYIGDWVYGSTTTVFNSDGKHKRIPARKDQRVVRVPRPALRIIDQPTWAAAQQRIAELRSVYGMKKGGRRRGPTEHYRRIYAKNLLYGLIRCAACGGKFIFAGNGQLKALGCSNHRGGGCPVSARVPLPQTERRLFDILSRIFMDYSDWLKIARSQMTETLRVKLNEIPDVLKLTEKRLRDVEQRINHMLDALAQGIKGESVQQKLNSLEAEKTCLSERLAEIQQLPASENPMPSDEWLGEQLRALSSLLADHQPGAISICREILGEIIAEEVKSPGKRRGYIRLRFQLQPQVILTAAIKKALPAGVLALLEKDSPMQKVDEILVDMGKPTRMDEWAPQIVEWREKGVPWHEISRRTGLKIANAHIAWKRYVEAKGNAA
jgi:site-specific DNA recombinase